MHAETKRKTFLEISSTLTGVAIDSFKPPLGGQPPTMPKPGDLAPRNSPIDLAGAYLITLETHVSSPTVDTLLESFLKLRLDLGGALKAAERLLSDPVLGPICRSIMKLWYLGIWYSPLNPAVPVQVVSSQAYKEGLVWKVMQAHPMGYSMWTFGYWADDPPSLDRFVSVG